MSKPELPATTPPNAAAGASTSAGAAGAIVPTADDLAALQALREPMPYYTGWRALLDIRRHAAFWSWSLALAMVDLISKRVVLDILPLPLDRNGQALPGGSITVLDEFFNIHTTPNYGAAFSMGTGKVLLLAVISLVVLLGLVYWRMKGRLRDWPRFGQWGICMVFAGALGNLYDRMIFGYVRDFLDFKGVPVPWQWSQQFPIFNVADSFLTVGIVMFLIIAWFKPPKFEEDAAVQASTGAPASSQKGPSA